MKLAQVPEIHLLSGRTSLLAQSVASSARCFAANAVLHLYESEMLRFLYDYFAEYVILTFGTVGSDIRLREAISWAVCPVLQVRSPDSL